MAKRKLTYRSWFLLGLLGCLLAAPNATIIKYVTGSLSPFLFNSIRFGLLAILTLPFLYQARRKFSAKNLRYVMLAGLFMAAAVVFYVQAIAYSQASYVVILSLLTPIVFVLYATRMTNEKVNLRSAAGIALAAAGAFTIVALPIALKQQASFHFYPLATLFVLINVFTFPLMIIYSKKSNESGLPLTAILNIVAWWVFVLNLIIYLVSSWKSPSPVIISWQVWVGIIYSGAIVAFTARWLNVASYEHIGAAVSSALAYLETLIAIIIPVVILHETLSTEMVVGGALILLGVYLVEHHKSKHNKHFNFLRNQ